MTGRANSPRAVNDQVSTALLLETIAPMVNRVSQVFKDPIPDDLASLDVTAAVLVAPVAVAVAVPVAVAVTVEWTSNRWSGWRTRECRYGARCWPCRP